MNQNLKVVLAVESVDLRKSFNGLYAIARNELGEIPEDGALFIFSNRAQVSVLLFHHFHFPNLGKPSCNPVKKSSNHWNL